MLNIGHFLQMLIYQIGCNLCHMSTKCVCHCGQVAVGYNYVIAVSNERMVYTWGEGGNGQLGHGTQENHSFPEVVQALKGKSIVR